jgi:riboflavin kinase / FMN adenylyltransferase
VPADFRIFRSLEEAASGFGPCALTIGNFDGVHGGHRHILRRVREVAEQNNWKASVMMFDPHPARVVAPARAPLLMTTPEQRCQLMRSEGIVQALILPFNQAVAHLTPDEFVKRVLVRGLDARAVLVGENFRFGHKQAGDTASLSDLGKRFGFRVEVIPAISWRGVVVSSSAVRRMVQAGDVSRASRLLARPFALEGRVVPGHGIGAKKTVPTLNLETNCEVLPAGGVYVTLTTGLDDGSSWPSVTNVGFRPTFDGDQLSIESYLLEPLAGQTPRHIAVEFLRRVRDERKFETPEALKTQIFRDVARAQSYHRRLRKWTVCYHSKLEEKTL